MQKNIAHYKDINESHEATHYAYRTDLQDFHIFTMESTYPETVKVMPPYSKGFYQISFINNSEDVTIDMDTQIFRNANQALFFQAPNQVLSWVRGEAQSGYIIYFKEEFMSYMKFMIEQEFPFFNFLETNYFPVKNTEAIKILPYFKCLLSTFESNHPYRVQLLRSLLQPLLYECKAIYYHYKKNLPVPSRKQVYAARLQSYINQYYLEKKSVAEYALLLNVTPGYLSEVIKEVTGTSPLKLITDRILMEAKNLISYTENDISQVAFSLGFDEPTHFSRFFKKHIGISPQIFRENFLKMNIDFHR